VYYTGNCRFVNRVARFGGRNLWETWEGNGHGRNGLPHVFATGSSRRQRLSAYLVIKCVIALRYSYCGNAKDSDRENLLLCCGDSSRIVALLIYDLAVPGSFAWFFELQGLGYRTKAAIVLVVAFIVGNTLSTFLNSVLVTIGAFCGSMIAARPFQQPSSLAVAPWRDARWRLALRRRLGERTPNDSALIPQALYDLRLQGIGLLPEADRPAATYALNRDRLQAEIDDSQWAAWYDQYHQKVLVSRDKWDVQSHVAHGLDFNLKTAAVYVLISAFFVQRLHHWWCLLPASVWTVLLILEQYGTFRRFLDPWTSISGQIDLLLAESNDIEVPRTN
jgi:hypothetical protein